MITKLGPADSYTIGQGITRNERVHISKGTRIYALGYGMNEQEYVVYDDDMHAVEICTGNPDEVNEYDLDRYFSPIITLEDTTRPISKKFGIGCYYDESDEVISDEVINCSLKRADNIKRLEEEVERRKAKEAEEMRQSLAKEYAYLERAEKYDHKTCGRNIRTELGKKYPGTRFSVKYESFSGGDAYRISWTNGPTETEVRKLLMKFADMHSDYTGDYWDCKPSIFNELFGSVGYISTHRDEKAVVSGLQIIEYSEKAIALVGDTKAIREQLKAIGGKFNPRLSCGAGWIFSAKRRAAVEALIK